MIYLYIEKNQIKILTLRKSLFGQYETTFFAKHYTTDLMFQGKVASVDLAASAIKEVLNLASPEALKDKEVFLVLPQDSFLFTRIEVPTDIASSAILSFIRDKARVKLQIDLDEYAFDYFIEENPTQKQINLFCINSEILNSFQETLQLIELNIMKVLPETLAFFKLFEKTLRKDKKENILYAIYEKEQLSGYLYDSYGLISSEKWSVKLSKQETVEDSLKMKVAEYEKQGVKLNRLILSGEESEHIRQDTFTKTVGVWTNPLKRIIPHFYQEYVKLLVTAANKPFPILILDACFGAFIFSEENKKFHLLKKGIKPQHYGKIGFLPSVSVRLPWKEISIFFVSFIVSFGLFLFVSKVKFPPNLLSGNKTNSTKKQVLQPTLSPIISPTPSIKREDVKIKILNGSGVVGKASQIKDILKAKGYQDIVKDNADNFDYEQSVLKVKKSKGDAFQMLQADLKDNVATFKKEVLDEKENADAILIFGKDFK